MGGVMCLSSTAGACRDAAVVSAAVAVCVRLLGRSLVANCRRRDVARSGCSTESPSLAGHQAS